MSAMRDFVEAVSAASVNPADWPWSPEFTPAEMACKGSGQVKVSVAFMDRLHRLRKAYGKPMRITSGYRSPAHNMKVSSTGANGPHTTGRAVDIAVARGDAYEVSRLAFLHGFTGIGWQQKGASRFVHLDDLANGEHPRPAVWSY
jgi:hypothetical protein